ncbi:Ig-like domain-containing protein [Psychromonas algicola]|uniref:Ig-like domain-containing protein n=1 Tax=Psychromonas algicola TaxID=2555642 RepID=UPI00106831E6|nr:Ig-like domain-containing protein [Psychromonas sp. RZ5]TEW51724.1 hypothetical protein E2R67_05770 [Psychromonas sp. RZ5]
MSLVLIKTTLDGAVTKIALPSAQIINVEANAHYTIIDSVTGKAPESLQIVKANNDLVIQQGAENASEQLVKIEQFFEAETEASFAADGSSQLANTVEGNLITSSSSEAFAPSIAGESGLVWKGAAAQSTASVGASSASVISNTLLYSLAGGAAGLTAAGVAVASSSDSSSSDSSSSDSTADTTAPSVMISDDTTGTATGDVTYTFTFSEEVTGFTVDDVVITGGTAGTLTSSDNITYTLVVTPDPDSTTDITVDVAADVATDLAGNGNTVAITNTQTVDTIIPSVVITDDTTGTATGDVTYTFTFSEEVTGFTAGDIVITGGTAGTLTSSDNITYTLVVTPESDSTTDITVDVAADMATDLAGNGNTVAITNTQTVNTFNPAIVITNDTTGAAAGDVTYTFTFSEEMMGFTIDDIVITGGTAGSLSTSDNITYTLVVTPDPDSTTDITVDVAADVATDAAGNGNTAAITNTQAVDTQAPTAIVTETASGNDEVVIGNDESVSVQSSEVGTGYLVHSSVTVTDVASITNSDDSLWSSVEITAADTDTELSAIGLDYGEYTFYSVDEAGNLSDASDEPVYVADTSIVVFDLAGGNSSSHSDRTFDANVDYTIYLVIDSSASNLGNSEWSSELWEGASNLDSGDTIVFVGSNGSPEFGNIDIDYASRTSNGASLFFVLNSTGVPRSNTTASQYFRLYANGSLSALTPNGDYLSNQNLWTGTWYLTNGSLGNAIPSGILTSQGLA